MIRCTPKSPLIWHTITILIFTTVGVMLLFLLYLSLQPFKPVIQIFNPRVLNSPIVAGEPILLDYDYCKNQDTINGQVVRYLKDTVITYLPTQPSNVRKGCGHSTLSVDTPKNLAPDTYTLNYEITYQINPIKTETYYFESPKFEVIK